MEPYDFRQRLAYELIGWDRLFASVEQIQEIAKHVHLFYRTTPGSFWVSVPRKYEQMYGWEAIQKMVDEVRPIGISIMVYRREEMYDAAA